MNSIHASCVTFGPVGVLIRGDPGSGKSSLCLRLLDSVGFGLGSTALVAMLVADDQTQLRLSAGHVIASAPPALAGKLEIRGLGIVTVPFAADTWVRLVVDLVAAESSVRMPEIEALSVELCGMRLPRLMIHAAEADAAAKVRAALGHFGLGVGLQNASI